MRNINKELSLIEVENFHSMIANVKDQSETTSAHYQVK